MVALWQSEQTKFMIYFLLVSVHTDGKSLPTRHKTRVHLCCRCILCCIKTEVREPGERAQRILQWRKSHGSFYAWVITIKGLLEIYQRWGFELCLFLIPSPVGGHILCQRSLFDYSTRAKWKTHFCNTCAIKHLSTIFTFSVLPFVFPGFKTNMTVYNIQYWVSPNTLQN